MYLVPPIWKIHLKPITCFFMCYSISTKREKKFLKFKHIRIQTICYPPKRVVGSV